ncbi:kelch domain-containing protein 7A [Alosa sapidissima]|uniref:kelch domain-containing protein 7A n=1 Tax=Alosa sapidissima TaxID=34773 RepID=UPI001C084B74|nr:kelch domain-containing protein 7A [Alosa sapidissima]
MPTADVLAAHFDMQLLGKLTLSVATVLFISWAYRFYSSRGRRGGQIQQKGVAASTSSPPPPLSSSSSSSPPPSSLSSSSHHASGSPPKCSSCKMELRPRGKVTPEAAATGNSSPRSRQVSKISVCSAATPDRGDAHVNNGGQRPGNRATADHIITTTVAVSEKTSQSTRDTEACSSVMSDLERQAVANKLATTLTSPSVGRASLASPIGRLSPCPVSPTGPLSPGLASPTGRLSPSPSSPTGRRSPACLLRKLDGAVEVGRELFQDTSHQGNFSSFQSKAEVKVEEGDLVFESPAEGGGKEVRGKIYDYFVESSSHSISDVNSSGSPTSVCYHSSHPIKLVTLHSTSTNSNDLPHIPRTISPPLIMRDVVFSQGSSVDDNLSPTSSNSSPRDDQPKRGLLRQDSYLIAAANYESPCMTGNGSGPLRGHSPAPLSADVPFSSVSLKMTATPDKDEPSLETVAGAKFVHVPLEGLSSSDWESLTGKLDLGNCLEALELAKKHGHGALQLASLRVMSDNYLKVLRDPGLYGRLRAGEREQIQRLRMKGRQCLMVADMESPDWSRRSSPQTKETKESPRTSGGLYYYDDYKDTWHRQCDIPPEVASVGSAMCTMDNYLFVAVGCQGSDRAMVPSRKVFCFNPVTSIWREICPMNEARPHCKLVALQGHLYAIGGECLSTVERYDPRADRWTFVAPLPNDTFAVAHRATACNGELFVSGGTLRYTLLRYSPKTNTWRQSLIVGTKERTTEMLAVRSFLYRFDVNPLFGINIYRYHTAARLWYECCTKQLPHCPAFQCVAMSDVIYCVSRQFTMRFLADEVSPGFVAEDLSVLSTAKGILFPFVLALPDKSAVQTSV